MVCTAVECFFSRLEQFLILQRTVTKGCPTLKHPVDYANVESLSTYGTCPTRGRWKRLGSVARLEDKFYLPTSINEPTPVRPCDPTKAQCAQMIGPP